MSSYEQERKARPAETDPRPPQHYVKKWGDLMACQKSDLDPIYFSDPDNNPKNPRVIAAKEVCTTCLVSDMCLKQGLTVEEEQDASDPALWGGLTPREREILPVSTILALDKRIVQGLSKQPKTELNEAQTAQIRQLSNVSPDDIARRVGVSVAKVTSVLPLPEDKLPSKFFTVSGMNDQITETDAQEPKAVPNKFRTLREQGLLPPEDEQKLRSEVYHPVATRDQEYLLFKKLRDGEDVQALVQDTAFLTMLDDIPMREKPKWGNVLATTSTLTELIATCNHRLVTEQALGFRRRTLGRQLTVDELVQTGKEGLLRAIERFDPEKGYRFYSYAVPWVVNSFQKEIRRKLGLEDKTYQAINKGLEISYAFDQVYGKKPTAEETANLLLYVTRKFTRPFPIEAIDRGVSFLYSPRIGSLNEKLHRNEKNSAELGENIDQNVIDVREAVIEREKKQRVQNAIHTRLTPEERTIVIALFNMNDEGSQSLQELAQKNGTTEQDITETLAIALDKLHESNELQKEKKQRVGAPSRETVLASTTPETQESAPSEEDTFLLWHSLQQQIEEIQKTAREKGGNLSWRQALSIRREAAQDERAEAIDQWMNEHPRDFTAFAQSKDSYKIKKDDIMALIKGATYAQLAENNAVSRATIRRRFMNEGADVIAVIRDSIETGVIDYKEVLADFDRSSLATLTPNEVAVAIAFATPRSASTTTSQLAKELSMSKGKINVLLSSLFQKLKVNNRVHLMATFFSLRQELKDGGSGVDPVINTSKLSETTDETVYIMNTLHSREYTVWDERPTQTLLAAKDYTFKGFLSPSLNIQRNVSPEAKSPQFLLQEMLLELIRKDSNVLKSERRALSLALKATNEREEEEYADVEREQTERELSVDESRHPLLQKKHVQLLFQTLATREHNASVLREDPVFIASIPARERELWNSIFDRSSTVTDIILACNYRLVMHHVNRLSKRALARNMERKDLEQTGNEGLLHAIANFDVEGRKSFVVHASQEIRNALYAEAKRNHGLSKDSYRAINEAYKLAAIFETIYTEKPTPQELSDLLLHTSPHISFVDIDTAVAHVENSRELSLNYLIEEKTELLSVLSHYIVGSRDYGEQYEQRVVLDTAMKQTLTPDEQAIVRDFLTVAEEQDSTIQTVAQKRGMTEQDITTILAKVLPKLQKSEALQKEQAQRTNPQKDIFITPLSPPPPAEEESSHTGFWDSLEEQAKRLQATLREQGKRVSLNEAKKLRRKQAANEKTEAVARFLSEKEISETQEAQSRELDPRQQQVLEYIHQGFSRREIANMPEMSLGSVAYIIRQLTEAGLIEQRTPQTGISKKVRVRRESIKEQLAQDSSLTAAQLAEMHGVSKKIIWRDLQEIKAEQNSEQDTSPHSEEETEIKPMPIGERRALERKLYAEGRSFEEIGAAIHRSAETVKYDLYWNTPDDERQVLNAQRREALKARQDLPPIEPIQSETLSPRALRTAVHDAIVAGEDRSSIAQRLGLTAPQINYYWYESATQAEKKAERARQKELRQQKKQQTFPTTADVFVASAAS